MWLLRNQSYAYKYSLFKAFALHLRRSVFKARLRTLSGHWYMQEEWMFQFVHISRHFSPCPSILTDKSGIVRQNEVSWVLYRKITLNVLIVFQNNIRHYYLYGVQYDRKTTYSTLLKSQVLYLLIVNVQRPLSAYLLQLMYDQPLFHKIVPHLVW